MPNLEQDRRFLEAGLNSLADYLLSNELFYPLDGDLPRLTVGNFLLAQLRVSTVEPFLVTYRIEEIKEKWLSAWEQKAAKEIHSRFGLWLNFLRDYGSSPSDHADRYPVEVRNRAILQLLSLEAGSTAEISLLPELDIRLNNSFIPGMFVWEEQVAPGFDQNAFWFLFGMLKSR